MAEGHRVAINCRFETQATTGVQRYAAEIKSAMALSRRGSVVSLHPDSVGVRARYWELLELPGAARNVDCRIVLNMCNWGPIRSSRTRNVVVLHDAIPEQFPEHYSTGYRAARALYVKHLRRSEDILVTVSQTSKAALEELLQRSVSVVPCGVRKPAIRHGVPLDDASRAETPYALFVGAHDPRKNAEFVEKIAPGLRSLGLSVVATTRDSGRVLQRGSFDASAEMRYVRSPSDDELWALYRGASVVLCPSVGEGFGLPALEAAAVGTPFVGTATGAALDVAADPDVQIQPLDLGLWTEAVRSVLDQGVGLRERVAARSSAFTWERSAELMWDICVSDGWARRS